MELHMATVRPTEDIQPLTSFRANAASLVAQVRTTGRPLVLTQHGRSAAVLMGVAEYEAMVEELEALRDIQLSERQALEGRVVPHAEARRQILEFIESQVEG